MSCFSWLYIGIKSVVYYTRPLVIQLSAARPPLRLFHVAHRPSQRIYRPPPATLTGDKIPQCCSVKRSRVGYSYDGLERRSLLGSNWVTHHKFSDLLLWIEILNPIKQFIVIKIIQSTLQKERQGVIWPRAMDAYQLWRRDRIQQVYWNKALPLCLPTRKISISWANQPTSCTLFTLCLEHILRANILNGPGNNQRMIELGELITLRVGGRMVWKAGRVSGL